MNDTELWPFDGNRTTSEMIEIGYHSLAIAIGIPANVWASFRYYDIWKSRPCHRRTVLLGANLTVANLFILLIYAPNQVFWLYNVEWKFGLLFCKIFMFLRVFGHNLSSNATVIVAIDMFLVLRSSLGSLIKSHKRTIACLIACNAIAAIACAMPQLFTWGLQSIPGTETKVQCMFLYIDDLTLTTSYDLFHVLSVFYLPLLFIVISYIWCTLRLRRFLKECKRLQQHQLLIAKRRNSDYSSHSGSIVCGLVNSRRIKRKMFIVSASVILLYVFSWLPYQSIALWNVVARLYNNAGIYEYEWSQYIIWLEALQICSACFNPILYTLHGL